MPGGVGGVALRGVPLSRSSARLALFGYAVAAGCRQPGAQVEGVGFGKTMTTENLFFWPGSRPWRTRTLDRDHDPAILSPVR
jgi:hypothetical protein